MAQSHMRKKPVMKKNTRYLGLQADTIAVAIADPEGEARSLGTIPIGHYRSRG